MFWAELPAALRTDMALELAGPIFAHSDIFKALDAASARQVAQRLAPLVVPAGHNVVQEGDDADSLFLLQEGGRLAPLPDLIMPLRVCSYQSGVPHS